jgi:acyl transferase domain-containing protein/phosphopantetheinyl transferase
VSTERARPSDGDIAVIGMACLFPGAPDLQAYWHNILGKVDAVSEPMPEWGAERYLDERSGAPRITTQAGGFLRDLYRFNPAEFGIMPSSVDGGEPDQFLALKIARDALADAGYADPDFDHTSTGVILGHSTYLHRGNAGVVQHGVVVDQTVELLRQLVPGLDDAAVAELRAALESALPPFNADIAPGLVPNVMTGRIANRLNLRGPNYLIDAACASSLLAVQSAMEELRAGRSDLMIAGGVNASIPAEVLMVFTQLGALSRRSKIRPFDAGADGTLLGEGLGAVVLKRLADAERDGDRIYAVLKAVGQSSDGKGLGLLAPRLEGEVLAVERAYRQCGLDPATIGLVEAHGTGIPLGDRTEITALTSVMGARAGDLPRCAIGSVKSMISHTIPAAGVASLIKTVLAVYHKVLPPTLCDEVNPALGLESTPFYVNTEARPWIHPLGSPRRAAVNAFGFGGINTHAVVEEHSAAPAAAAVAHWPSELVVFRAAGRDALIAQVERVSAFVAHRPEDSPLTLRDAAFTAAAALGQGDERLAVVATGLDDLVDKLTRALHALRDRGRHRLQTRSGVFYGDAPLDGGLAFLFPGEGAQYPGMLADLAMHFPVVRRWFDFWDSVYTDDRDFQPSLVALPPPTGLDGPARERLDKQLYGLEIGSESVFVANQALCQLLRSLGIEPDAILGHSSGENSALVAAGVVPLDGDAGLKEHILRLNRLYKKIEAKGSVVTGALLTVGAVPRDRILELVDASDGRLYLALDNCHHQAVLYGSREAIDEAATRLRGLGGLCTFLPFDRAYHTPKFEPISRAIREFFDEVPFRAARVPLYSCASADRFPDEPDAIRQLVAAQWSSRVRFIDAVERLYDDGVRSFVEIGPSGNLTAFVNDILRERDHLAVSSNNRNRPGLLQLQHLLARVFAAGRDFAVDALFTGRGAQALDFAGNAPAAPRRAPLLANHLPYARLDPATVQRIAGIIDPAQGAECAVERGPAAHPGSAAALPAQPAVQDAAAGGGGEAQREGVLMQHLGLMQEFLAHQQRVLEASLGLAAPADEGLPLIHRVLVREPARAVAEIDLDVDAQRFLRHHVLYAREVSDVRAGAHSMAVVPLTVSLEMLAEVAGLVSARPHLAALADVRAYNWIALDHGTTTLRMEASLVREGEAADVVHAVLYEGDAKLIEGDVEFADGPGADAPLVTALQAPRASQWTDEQLYTTGMFHGPLFHSIAHLIGWDERGMDAELHDTPTAGFLAEGDHPRFLLNPVLLDAVGHVTAFWIAQSRGTDFSSFPSSIERIELSRPDAEDTAGCRLRGRLAFQAQRDGAPRFLTGDYDCVDAQGRALFRIQGWRDRFLAVPHAFYYARSNPREGWYGEDWSERIPDMPADTLVWYLSPFPDGFLEDAGAIWKRVLAHTVLSEEERLAWYEGPAQPERRTQWLLGRLAAKEAARRWIHDRTGVLLYPADVIVRSDENGRPFLAPETIEGLGAPPEISLAHARGFVVAAAAPPGHAVGIDLETFGRVKLPDLLDGAFTAAERARVEATPKGEREEWALRLWCAKEAAAKSLGLGLGGQPRAFEVRELSGNGRFAVVHGNGQQVPVSIQRQDEKVIALAYR